VEGQNAGTSVEVANKFTQPAAHNSYSQQASGVAASTSHLKKIIKDTILNNVWESERLVF
jgi:hypothetical protein